MSKSNIEWTEETWNPVTGCTKWSEGCKNCYAEKMTKRLAAMGQKKYAAGFDNVVFHTEEMDKNFGKKPKMIFVNSMSDTFHGDVHNAEIKGILEFCAHNYQHTFQILTKRSDRLKHLSYYVSYPSNVWLGVTVEKDWYKSRIDDLRKSNAKVKFLSCEPLLSDLGKLDLTGINWVIVGGESGPNARPCNPDWVRNIQKQCAEQNIPFFFKQWGEFSCVEIPQNEFFNHLEKYSDFNIIIGSAGKMNCFNKVGKKKAGCLLDGKEYKEYPHRYQLYKI